MPLTPAARLVRGEQVGDLRLEGDLERVLLERRLVAPVRRRAVVEHGRVAQGRGARPGDPDRLGGDPVGLGRGQHGASDAKPHAPSTRTRTPKPSLSPEATPSTRPVLIAIALVAAPDDADVGVRRAPGGGRVEGAVGEVSHAPRSVAEARPEAT